MATPREIRRRFRLSQIQLSASGVGPPISALADASETVTLPLEIVLDLPNAPANEPSDQSEMSEGNQAQHAASNMAKHRLIRAVGTIALVDMPQVACALQVHGSQRK